MDADTRIAEDALDALGRSVRETAGHQALHPENVVRRGRRGRRRRTGFAVLAAALIVLAGVVTWRVVPPGNRDGLQFGGSGVEDRDLDREVFSVRSPVPLYWRLTALDDFDGTTWKSQSKFDPRGATGGTTVPATADDVAVEFSITGLDKIWLPTAGRFKSVASPVVVSGSRETGAVIVGSGTSLSGLTYTVYTDPRFPAVDVLEAAPDGLPAGSPDSTALPADLPAIVRTEAQAVAGNAPNRYRAAKALQEHLRSDAFASSDVSAGTGIEGFLRQRRGKTEQFAGAYAAMARSLGIPARIVVGYMQGIQEGDGRFHVYKRERHTWAEVWFEGVGWVGFDPTPDRGIDQPF
jgi:transglutaminase-like putative cysteine protease